MSRSMYVNLCAAAKTKSLAKEAEFYLQKIKEKTGRSFQNIICEAIIFTVNERAKDGDIEKEIVDSYKQIEGNA